MLPQRDSLTMDDPPSPLPFKEPVERRSSGYRSWKKKYRKMRIVFDRKMLQGEDLHRQQEKASATVKRLAIENDRLLDILLEINNSPQIPPKRRFDISLQPPSDPEALTLSIDHKRASHPQRNDESLKRLEQLLRDVPHSSYSTAKESHLSCLMDLAANDSDARPANFLSADDIDNYIHSLDIALHPDKRVPTLAPRAHPAAHPTPHPHLKNPTSVTNWLRKHAPKIFLQDTDPAPENAAGDDADAAPASATNANTTNPSTSASGPSSSRKSRPRASTSRKRTSTASRQASDRADWGGAGPEDDPDLAPPPSSGRSKRKRDDDPGYRPGGSSSRPAKKKRKSEADATPSVRRSKKDNAASKED